MKVGSWNVKQKREAKNQYKQKVGGGCIEYAEVSSIIHCHFKEEVGKTKEKPTEDCLLVLWVWTPATNIEEGIRLSRATIYTFINFGGR